MESDNIQNNLQLLKKIPKFQEENKLLKVASAEVNYYLTSKQLSQQDKKQKHRNA